MPEKHIRLFILAMSAAAFGLAGFLSWFLINGRSW
jgi:hypothetical protein